jgi:hypothetical protein
MGVAQENRHAILAIELADATGLFLGEQQPAVFGADDAVGVVRALPYGGPDGASGDHPVNRRDRHLALGLRLAAAALLGRRRESTCGENEREREAIHAADSNRLQSHRVTKRAETLHRRGTEDAEVMAIRRGGRHRRPT